VRGRASNKFYCINLNGFNGSVVQPNVLVAPESVATEVAGAHPVDNLTALQFQIHNDLRAQHPDWVQSNGDCPTCDFYEARLAELLEGYAVNGSDEFAAAVHRALQQAAAVNRLPAI